MDIHKTDNLLKEFKSIPVVETEDTYLEICHYPNRRFEEICSRLLCFFFDPRKEHKMNDLFISSLMELLNAEVLYDYNQIEIITEDNAEGKRIDLVITCHDFVIGIENKITATLYNQLQTYKKRLEEYSTDKIFKIVLSVFEITKPEEVKLMNDNGFVPITYSQFFETIKRNIGQYISGCNQKYLTHLFDFIQTIENMKSSVYSNKKLVEYFFDNEQNIKELISAFSQHEKEILNLHKERIIELKEEISKRTQVDWWAWQGWDLGYNGFEENSQVIGIEGSFTASKSDPYDKFRIYITTWKLKEFARYKDKVLKRFPNLHYEDTSIKNRAFLHMEPIDGNETITIINKLEECFQFVKEITKEENNK